MMTAAMVGYTLGYVLAAATRTHDGPALYVPPPRPPPPPRPSLVDAPRSLRISPAKGLVAVKWLGYGPRILTAQGGPRHGTARSGARQRSRG